MIEVTRYVASDGKEFVKREECIEYENTVELREAVKKISAHCMVTECEDCPFNTTDRIDNYCILESIMPSGWIDCL